MATKHGYKLKDAAQVLTKLVDAARGVTLSPRFHTALDEAQQMLANINASTSKNLTKGGARKTDLKLSPPQYSLLQTLVMDGPKFVTSTFPPALCLVSRGYARWVPNRTSHLEATREGEKVIG